MHCQTPAPAEYVKTRLHKVYRRNLSPAGVNHKGFYCHASGHLIAVCNVLRSKEQSKIKRPSPVGLLLGESDVRQREFVTDK